MDEPQRERNPESYFGAGIGGGRGLFTAGGTSGSPHSLAPAVPSVVTVTEPAREIPVGRPPRGGRARRTLWR